MPIKVCKNVCTRTLANGEKRKYETVSRYEVKGPKWTPEQIAEMKRLVAMGIKKGRICADFDISYATLNKYLKM